MSGAAFANTAVYYDLLYRDKDYSGEAAYVADLVRRHAPDCRDILEFGCGTGRYSNVLASLGYAVMGVDNSLQMLQEAGKKACSGVSFAPGDMRYYRSEKTFDAIIAMFHVVSYLTTNEDVARAFAVVARHLKPGGVFLFDCWYGPAVLTDRPVTRIRRCADETMDLVRIAEPVLDSITSTVTVDYQFFVRKKGDGCLETFSERHCLRYFFQPELLLLLSSAGLKLEHAEEFRTGRLLGFSSWYGCFVAKKHD